jgi:hypothetical protein
MISIGKFLQVKRRSRQAGIEEGLTMRSLPAAELDGDAVPDRRKKRGRRASDLDGAYNDGGEPTPLRLANAIVLYGGIVWIVITSASGSFFILKSAWRLLASLWVHG